MGYLRRDRADPRKKQPDLRLPHERDQSTDGTAQAPRPIIEQARRDIESGQQDTDRRGIPGLEKPKRRTES